MWLDYWKHICRRWQFKQVRWLGLVVLLGLVLIVVYGLRAGKEAVRQPSAEVKPVNTIQSSASKTIKRKKATRPAGLVVDIKGAVKRPGVYTCPANCRLQTALEQAGGPTEQAELKNLNLAQPLQDGLLIYVPRQGEELPAQAFHPSSTDQSTPSSDKVNVNTADEQALQAIPGIGQKRAHDIIAYRQAHGPFKEVADLKAITGIGEKMVARLADEVVAK